MPINGFEDYDPEKLCEIIYSNNFQLNAEDDVIEEFQDEDSSEYEYNSTTEESNVDIPYNPNDYYELLNLYDPESEDNEFSDNAIYNNYISNDNNINYVYNIENDGEYDIENYDHRNIDNNNVENDYIDENINNDENVINIENIGNENINDEENINNFENSSNDRLENDDSNESIDGIGSNYKFGNNDPISNPRNSNQSDGCDVNSDFTDDDNYNADHEDNDDDDSESIANVYNTNEAYYLNLDEIIEGNNVNDSINQNNDEESNELNQGVENYVSRRRYYVGSDTDDSERTHTPTESEILQMDSGHVSVNEENVVDQHPGVYNIGAHWFDPRVDVRKYYYYKGVEKTSGKAWNGMSVTQMKDYIEKIIYEVMFCLPREYKVEVYTFLDPLPDKDRFFYFIRKILWTEIGVAQIEVATNNIAHVYLRIEDEVLDEMPVEAFI